MGTVELDKVGGATWLLRICDPDTKNALSVEMRTQLSVLLREANHDPRCRVVVVTGEGGFFCSGADIRHMSVGQDEVEERLRVTADLALALWGLQKPLLAAVDGGAFGLGLSIVSACDVVVASETACFGASFGQLGLTGDTGISWFLSRRVGVAKARELILVADAFTAQKAEEWGVVSRLSQGQSALSDALALAGKLAGMSPPALRETKAILRGIDGGLDLALAAETAAQARLFSTEEFAARRAAFIGS